MSIARDMQVTSFTDADDADDKTTRKFISGAVLLVDTMPIGWQVKKRSAVAPSTAELEFVAAAVGAKEILGVKMLLEDMNVSVELPMLIMVDNRAAIKQIKNAETLSAQKHVDVKIKFVRDTTSKGIENSE